MTALTRVSRGQFTFVLFLEWSPTHLTHKTMEQKQTTTNNETTLSDDKGLGSMHLRIDDLPRNAVTNRFCKLEGVGSGEMLITIHRAPITSPQLSQILMKIIGMQQPWTKQMLGKFNVTLGSFLGTQPWGMPEDDKKNPALIHLRDLIAKGSLDFQVTSLSCFFFT